ncbi:transporter substrate-binding domain-containing protein (plasmid) [Agrobacterium fabrum]|uniref:transporter substrate-binding domain-containing protein n=1 Tax=Agrobacterium fabrum TaxID=1176649 RepID=UPI0021CEC555|nr:transporter substrate-binding domain-containing protein [Agrobacterium fabrum]UXT61167.1 transporter substrate-binding domain-containing protein [Agrobacterium fabrum]
MSSDVAASITSEPSVTGVLRVAINTANPVLARRNAADRLEGTSLEIAHGFGERLGCRIDLIPYESAGKVFAALEDGEWDLAFLAIEPERTGKAIFSPPYLVIEGTFAVRDAAPFACLSDLDRPGVRIGVALNAAYDLFLTRNLTKAELVRFSTPSAALDAFTAGTLDAVAGVRQSLQVFAVRRQGFYVLPDAFMEIPQGIAVPLGRQADANRLQLILREMQVSGRIREMLNRNGMPGVRVCNPEDERP